MKKGIIALAVLLSIIVGMQFIKYKTTNLSLCLKEAEKRKIDFQNFPSMFTKDFPKAIPILQKQIEYDYAKDKESCYIKHRLISF